MNKANHLHKTCPDHFHIRAFRKHAFLTAFRHSHQRFSMQPIHNITLFIQTQFTELSLASCTYMHWYSDQTHSLSYCLAQLFLLLHCINYLKKKYIFYRNYIYIYIYIHMCISINLNVVEKFIYFSNSNQIVKLVY